MWIETPEEFEFRECLVFLNRSPKEKLHRVLQDKVRTLVAIGDQPFLIEVSCPVQRRLCLTFVDASPDRDRQRRLANWVSEWFDLSTNLRPFYALAAADRLLAALVRRYRGLRMIRIHNLFQALCWAVIGQQINLQFAYTLYGRLIEAFGESRTIAGDSYWLFPRPEAIAGLSVAALQGLQFTRSKSEYLIGIARSMAEGALSKADLLRDGDLAQARRKLLAVRGVGPWTASYVMMRCLGDRSALPIEDIGLHKAVQLALKREHRPGVEEIRELAKAWRGWEAYATFYLYRSLL